MAAHKKNHYFVSALLIALIGLACMNLVNCGSTDSSPVISSISPSSAFSSGTSVSPSTTTLMGENFGTDQGAMSYVYFNKVLTTVSSWSDTNIVADIPPIVGLAPGATVSVPVVVSVNGLVSNAVTFTYIGS